MTVIDLGDRTEPTEPRPPRRRIRAGRSRSLLLPMMLAVLLVLTGAAPPAVRMQAVLPSSLAAEVFLTGEQIVAVVPLREAGGDDQEVLVYRRPERAGGHTQQLTPLWRLPIGPSRVTVAEAVGDDGLVLSLYGTDSDRSETMLLNSRTGQPRWRQPGIATIDASDRVLLHTFDGQDLVAVSSAELTTGRVLWSMPSRAKFVSYHQRAARVDALVVSTVAGDIEVLDPRTGTLRRRLPAVGDADRYQYAVVMGDLVLVVNPTRVAAYHVDELDRRWQALLASIVWVHPCGDLVCVRAGDGESVYILDPATGEIRWRVVENVNVLVASDARALVIDHRGSGQTVTTVHAGTRGADDAERWELVDGFGDDPELLGTRSIRDVGVVLARIDPTRTQPRRIDLLPGATGNCGYREDLIVCRRQDGDFGVWELHGAARRP
ncbi:MULTISPECIES: outer membrane protein assembly factor BamB family protein [Micromonospora]|uniref:outer membrane protein assembly factor BamB family protein n=1 Tax=Micromonospora TaxID=1873 RepID=UPI000C882176|nr:PQQ-binding-like beta-propeller repeat protein [Verrucosispora sp. ts21]PMR61619.1 hypothetical protein C1A38_07830 [Verrucosispora sp. ts21]